MKRFHARVAVVEALKQRGDYIETKDNPMNVPVCAYVSSSKITYMHDLTSLFLVCQKIRGYCRTRYEAPMVGQLQAIGGGGPEGEPSPC